jgi:hypothetical protein
LIKQHILGGNVLKKIQILRLVAPILEYLSETLIELDEVTLGHLFVFEEAGDLCAYDAVDVALIRDDTGYVLAAELIHQQVQQLLPPLRIPLIFLYGATVANGTFNE